MKSYRPRIIDSKLQDKLEETGAVLIEGPKWCGKTTTAEQASSSVIYMNDPSDMNQNISMVSIAPSILLEGDTPRLIDEWQLAPRLWDAIRFEVDRRGEQGQFILTGSAVPADRSEIRHSGAGRFSWLTMRPMTLFESGDSNGEVSLKCLFESNQRISGKNDFNLEKLAFLVCRGGWPQSIDMDEKVAVKQAYNYLDAVIKSDINRADGISKAEHRVKALLRSYARNQGSQTSLSKISDDISSNEAQKISDITISSYLNALRSIFVVEDMPAWNPNLRSKSAIRTSDTRYFVDPSIAVAALGIGPMDLINDLNTFGLLFETLAVRDLRVYAESMDGDVYHFRDRMDNECDAVIHLRNGKYALTEVKLGGDRLIEEGANNLLNIKNYIDTEKMGEPSFMAVITGVGGYAYTRPDGVHVIPIGCLRN